MLATRESADGVGPFAIVPLIETAAGLEAVGVIARSPRVSHLALGEADLRAELAVDPSDDEREWQPIRSRLVVASAAAGIGPPAGSAATDFTDLDRLRRSSETYRRLGFAARSAIHPAQIPVINEVFTPSPSVIERARRLVSLYEDVTQAGHGVAVDDHGMMIDEAVIRSARRTLELAEHLKA
jgi:citrate lyase subunit beta/citryl-CoA lyase